eukprot:TRINITY_DN9127_c0_g1_i1.p1 TRINITY_DN9127_c0_g1~~TRINITY_DN9127_c0_g1_i1.p1  ORF type:complete len:277 (-),score=9.13 TRINITY_DN9127_c0_g1_i1:14-844(-)
MSIVTVRASFLVCIFVVMMLLLSLVRSPLCSMTDSLLTSADAECLIQKLRPFPIADIGTGRWLAQHADLEQLNMQAYHSVISKTEEFIKESLVAHDKLPVLIEELLAVELWRAEIWPRLSIHVFGQPQAMLKSHIVARHEVVISNLLQTVMHHTDALQSGDSLLELLDYALRKLVWLNTNTALVHAGLFASADAGISNLEQSPETEFANRLACVDFQSALGAIRVVRAITECICELPLAVVNKLLKDHDTPSVLATCIMASPWRQKHRGKFHVVCH